MRQQLTELRRVMRETGADWCLIPSSDYHSSEYVGDFFKCRAYVSGFTGSAGTLLVSADWAGLWTDGRYFLQAAAQLADSGIELCKMGEPGVPTVEQFLEERLEKGRTLAFDGRVISARQFRKLKELAGKKGAALLTDRDLPGEIWTDRPALSAEPVFEFSAGLVGESRADKLRRVREKMRAEGADTLVLSSLADICWLMNIRGGDVACTPVVLSFCAVTAAEALLFINEQTVSAEIRSHLEADGVSLRPYGEIYAHVRALRDGARVMMDLRRVNSLLLSSVPAGCELLNRHDPTDLMKAVKNPTEVKNMREAHVKDGVAVTRLMYWLKHNVGKIPMDELSVADKLEELRREQPGYLMPSFDPIIGYGPHGAIVHYKATEESCAAIEPRSLLLADTGGHYLEGTTDITRTFAMGPVTEEERRFFTLVLKGHLRLGAARFRYGCTGLNLDYLAHSPLWEIDMDYNHGTGHGVGYVLSVHEGPQGFRWKQLDQEPAVPLEPGMITSDEPGIYLEGKFGVRHESMTVVCEGVTNSYGRFLHMEYLTMVPFDLDALDPDLLGAEELRSLNAYHRQVRETILPFLSGDEAEWLKHATREVGGGQDAQG